MSITINKQKIIKLLLSTKRKNIDKVITYMDENNFWACYASTKWHGVFEGGLAEHCLQVYKLFKELCDRFNIKIRNDEIIIIAILHDLCKCTQYTDGQYNSNKNLGHAIYTLDILKKLGVQLTELEKLCIKYHMEHYHAIKYDPNEGEYNLADYVDISNKHYVVKLFHICDELAACFMEK
jgi:putative nucleotidyltransferase with HDIG domain